VRRTRATVTSAVCVYTSDMWTQTYAHGASDCAVAWRCRLRATCRPSGHPTCPARVAPWRCAVHISRRTDRSWSAQQLGTSSAPSSGPRSGGAFRLPVLSRRRSRRGRQRSCVVDKDVSSGGGCAAQEAQATVKLMGSADRADGAASPTGGARSQAKVATGSPAAPVAHRSAPHRQLRDSVESSLASGAASRRVATSRRYQVSLR
jgi:hypothetical protein